MTADFLQKNFILRLLSGLVLAPAVLGLIWQGGPAYAVLIVSAGALVAYEWHRLTGQGQGRGRGLGLLISYFLVAVVPAASLLVRGDMVLALGLLALGTGLAMRMARPLGKLQMQTQPMRTTLIWPLIGCLVIGLPVSALIWLRLAHGQGMILTFWLFGVVWATDICAYFAGRAIGGPKLAPQISPNKTWAGLAAGMAGAFVVGAVLAAQGLLDPAWGVPLIVGLISAAGAVLAQMGDLCESALKRRFNVKDSGTLIPGHGGILDRVDGLLAVSVLVYMLWARIMFFG